MWRKLIYILTFILLILIGIFIYMFLTSQADEDFSFTVPRKPERNVVLNIKKTEDAYPVASTGDTIVKHTGFDLLYNEQYEQAGWVAYILTKEMVETEIAERKDNFKQDPLISTQSAHPNDYKNTGFDRGHLIPAADLKWTKAGMRESFYMSNISPQVPAFNRGIWKKLENMVRNWTMQNDSLYIVTGPYLQQIEKRIGENKVAVPRYYFKAILDISYKDGYKAAGFWLPNQKGDETALEPISIDELERLTGIDFFSYSDLQTIEEIESKIQKRYWR